MLWIATSDFPCQHRLRSDFVLSISPELAISLSFARILVTFNLQRFVFVQYDVFFLNYLFFSFILDIYNK